METKHLKILWVNPGPLHPLDRGGSIRTYNMLKVLKKKNDITYLSFAGPDTDHKIKLLSAGYSHRSRWIASRKDAKHGLVFFIKLIKNTISSGLPYSICKYRSGAMKKAIRSADKEGKYDLIICDFLASSINFPERTRTPAILFQHNVESIIWKRHYENHRNVFSAAYLYLQFRRMKKYERMASSKFDGVITVSKNDTKLLERELGYRNVIGNVETGVDARYFSPMAIEKKPKSLVFSGSMDWMPNIDAVIYFVHKIYPSIKKAFPDISFRIVGRKPPERVKLLSVIDKSIEVTGTVEDIRPYVGSSEAYVVPLRIGSGTRIKILEAMSMGVTVVSTEVGAEGLGVSDNKNILIAHDPDKFAEAVIGILRDSHRREAISKEARKLVEERFSWEVVTQKFEQLITKAAKGKI